MTELKPGVQLASLVCETRVVVVLAGAGAGQLTCGGQPMVAVADATAPTGTVPPEHAGPTTIGKRYVDASGSLEVLCTKAGAGRLAVAGEPLETKAAKALPSSD